MSTDAALQAQRIPGTDKLLKIDDAIFRHDLGNRPFRMNHNLVDHPLLKIPRLIELAVDLGDYSISLSITYRTRGCDRLGCLYAINHEIRQRGGNPKPAGQSPLRDTFVDTTHRIRRRVRSVVGRLETNA